MSRPLRIEYPDAYYHVMNRGAAKQIIFHSYKHYQLFILLLDELHKKFHIKIHAYCLMPNHYHILLQTPLANLSCAMRHLNSLYTRRFNLLQNRDGPLLRGRFNSVIVEDEKYLLRLSRYIHLNPVAAKIIVHAKDYLWSSYRAYLNKKHKPDWLITDDILNRFGPDKKIYKYRMFIAAGTDEEINTFYKKLKLMPVLGCEAFIKTIYEKYLKNQKLSPEISQQKYLKPVFKVELIMHVVANRYNIDEAKIKTPNIKQTTSLDKLQFICHVNYPDRNIRLLLKSLHTLLLQELQKFSSELPKKSLLIAS